jgi:four helix bundle protein
VRTVDSIGANIAESYGRYAYGDKIQFLLYARGSLFETKFWLCRMLRRNLVTVEQVEKAAQQLDLLAKEINGFVRKLRSQKSAGKGTVSHGA